MANTSKIISLSQAIASDTAIVEQYFQENGLPSPTFDEDGPHDFKIPPKGEVFDAYSRLVDNTRELHLLMLGPSRALRGYGHFDTMALQAVYRLKIPQAVPLDSSASYEELAAAAKIDPTVLRRLLKFAMGNYIFQEDSAGRVRHTLFSRRMVDDRVLLSAVGQQVDESFPGATRTIESIMRNGDTIDPLQCGWALANNAQAPYYEELNTRLPERAKVVADAMDNLARMTPVDQLENSYPWAELGQATVVDVGGGRGPVGKALAKRFDNLHCIVQDLEPLTTSGAATLDPALAGRVTFMPHNFFQEQPVKGADVYLFRNILHDWPDQSCVQILRALTSALKVGSRIVINEFVIPERGAAVSSTALRYQRIVDLNMMVLFNGSERELKHWKDVIDTVHPQMKFVRAYHTKVTGEDRLNPSLAIVEAVWTEA